MTSMAISDATVENEATRGVKNRLQKRTQKKLCVVKPALYVMQTHGTLCPLTTLSALQRHRPAAPHWILQTVRQLTRCHR